MAKPKRTRLVALGFTDESVAWAVRDELKAFGGAAGWCSRRSADRSAWATAALKDSGPKNHDLDTVPA